jgi:hypothetical protein
MSNARNIANLPNGDDAPVYACRAWVNFDGTTNTAGFCTIRDSGNVSSITDLANNCYRVNFTTNMDDANYAVSASGGNSSNGVPYLTTRSSNNSDPNVAYIEVQGSNGGNGSADLNFAYVAIFR